MKIHKILCAVDPDSPSTAVTDAAIALAAASQAGITLVAVVPVAQTAATLGFGSPGSGRWALAGSADMAAKGVRESQVVQSLQLRKAEAQKLTTGEVEIQVSHGAADETLVSLAQSGEFDLVVIGGGGKQGLLSSLLGSISYKVVRSAPCSVYVVRAPPT